MNRKSWLMVVSVGCWRHPYILQKPSDGPTAQPVRFNVLLTYIVVHNLLLCSWLELKDNGSSPFCTALVLRWENMLTPGALAQNTWNTTAG